MAVLVNPDFPVAESQAQELHAAARKLGLEFHILHASSERDLDMIFVKMVEMRVGALAITADPFFLSRREQILTLATRHSLPAMSPWREAAAAGGLVSYGTSASDGYRQVGQYAGRILKGEKPADLPVAAEMLALGPSCGSHRRSSSANSLCGRNSARSPEIYAIFQRDILPRHFGVSSSWVDCATLIRPTANAPIIPFRPSGAQP